MLISHHYGIPSNYCRLQSTNLEKTEFWIRSALGDSKEMYKQCKSNPIHGIDQGSCSSPAIWLLISSFIMDLLQNKAHGMTMEDILSSDTLRQFIEGFVDDMSIFTNLDYKNQNILELLKKGQSDGQLWESLLRTTGGELELSKCFYYLISWKWDKHGNPIPQTISEQNIPQIQIKLANNVLPTKLTQMEVFSSHKTLGTHKCITGKELDHFEYLLEKSNNIASLVEKSQFNKKIGLDSV
jgi:hypothetical protein